MEFAVIRCGGLDRPAIAPGSYGVTQGPPMSRSVTSWTPCTRTSWTPAEVVSMDRVRYTVDVVVIEGRSIRSVAASGSRSLLSASDGAPLRAGGGRPVASRGADRPSDRGAWRWSWRPSDGTRGRSPITRTPEASHGAWPGARHRGPAGLGQPVTAEPEGVGPVAELDRLRLGSQIPGGLHHPPEMPGDARPRRARVRGLRREPRRGARGLQPAGHPGGPLPVAGAVGSAR